MSQNDKVSRKDYKKSSTKENKTKPKKWFKRIILTFITVFLLVVVAGGALFAYYASNAPEMTQDDLTGTFSSELVDKDGNVFYTLGAETREYADPDEYPEVMHNAMTAIEDQRFYDHMGIDPIGIGRAALGYITNRGQIVGGGSTITQQLVKLSVFSTTRADQTLERKAQEAWLALQVERELSKEQIITLYMNKIHMAGNVYGISTAAEEYYGKPVSELEIHEAALFAGMAQAPNRYNPYVNPEIAKDRRDVVIDVMRNEGHITDEEAEAAFALPIEEGLVERSEDQNDLVFDAYLQRVLDEVEEKTELDPATAGLTIETNIDMNAQQRVFDVLNSDEYVDYINDDVEAAVSLVEADTGKVRALGGGRNTEGLREFNHATHIKQTGSTIKPLSTYGPAIEYLEYPTYHQIEDEEYTLPGSDFSPRNYDRQFKGQISMREALVDSRNVPTAKLFNEDLEMNQVEEFMTNLGIPIEPMSAEGTLVPQNAYNGEMTSLQMAASYASFANGGNYTEPYTVSKVITQDGQEIDLTPETNQAMSDYTAYMVTDMLKDVASSNNSTVGIGNIPQAGKTGTTNFSEQQLTDYGYPEDAVPSSWYAGYTSTYSLSVWTGFSSAEKGYLTFDDGTRLLPRHIYREIMQYVSEGVENSDWQMPSSVSEVTVEDGTNPAQLPGPNTPASARVTELFVQGTEPTQESVSYGEELSAPSGLSAEYDEDSDELTVTWDEYTLENEEENASYTLSINGDTTTLSDTEYTMSEPPEGQLTISLSVTAYNTTGPEATTSVTVPERVEDEPEEEEIEEEEEEVPEDEETNEEDITDEEPEEIPEEETEEDNSSENEGNNGNENGNPDSDQEDNSNNGNPPPSDVNEDTEQEPENDEESSEDETEVLDNEEE